MASKDIILKIHIHSFILTKQFILLRVMEDPDPGILQVRLEYTLETLVNGWECVCVCVCIYFLLTPSVPGICFRSTTTLAGPWAQKGSHIEDFGPRKIKPI